MAKKVLDVGNCGPDHSAICQIIRGNFDADVVQAHGSEDALEALRSEPYDLVLVNRKLDRDYSDGLRVIEAIKSDDQVDEVPVMMVTNYEEHQQQAVAAGAVPGFGKLALAKNDTLEKLRAYLD